MIRPCKDQGDVRKDRDGFTLVELLISLVLGLVVLTAALNFAVSSFRGSEGNKLREEIYRSARFIGMTLERDFQSTGVGIESEISFGTLGTYRDTVVTLHIPWEPTWAYAHEIVPPAAPTNPLPPGGTCGATCIDLKKDPLGNHDLEPGDVARLQVNSERRLILITNVDDLGTTFRVTFSPDTTLLNLRAAFAGGLLLDRTTTFVQEIQPFVYYVVDGTLYRADRMDASGNLIGSPMAYGVKAWDAKIMFVDGDEADEVNPDDPDFTNDYDDLLGVRITATLATNRPDIRINQGQIFTRDYEWRLVPRNLMYERNR